MVMGGSMLSERLQKMAKLKMYRMIFKSFCKFYKTNSDSSQMLLADPTNTVSKHSLYTFYFHKPVINASVDSS